MRSPDCILLYGIPFVSIGNHWVVHSRVTLVLQLGWSQRHPDSVFINVDGVHMCVCEKLKKIDIHEWMRCVY